LSMMYKRAFLFGCSFTRYIYPTWADMLEYYNPDISVFNFARSGIGNVGISYRLVEADVKYQFNNTDLIVVVWTYFNRKDLFNKGDWFTEGNIFSSDYYGKDYIKKYWTIEHGLLENFSSIILSNKSYTLNDQYCTIPIEHYCKYELSHNFLETKDLLNKLPNIKNFQFKNNSKFCGFSKDPHPDIECHISFYNDHIAKKNNLITIPEMNTYKDHQKEIVKILEKVKNDDLNIQNNKIINYFNPLRLSTNLFGQRY